MRVVKVLLTLVLVMGLVAGTAYGAGALLRHHDQRTAAASSHPQREPASDPTSSAPPSSPSTSPSTSSQTASPEPATRVMRPGAKGSRVRALQVRLHQLAWLPETTTGVYDDATVAAVKGFQAKRGLDRTGLLDRRTWQRLVAMTDRPGHDAMFNVLHPGKTVLGPGDEGSSGARQPPTAGDAEPLRLAQDRGHRVAEAGRVAQRSPPAQPRQQRLGRGDVARTEPGQLGEDVGAHRPDRGPVEVRAERVGR